jgi:hypothetical protein
VLTDKPSLASCEAKFGRAKAHTETLRAELAAALERNPHRLRFERDEEARQYVFYVEELPPVDETWSLTFGDAVHNFRATLDHLVVQLAILGKGSALNEAEVRSAEFPVFDDPGRWEKVSGPSAVKLLRAGERERIRELQPFNARDRSIWGVASQLGSGARPPRLIEALHRVDVEDKHRFVHPSLFAVKTVELPPVQGIISALAHGEALKTGDEIGRWGVGPNAIPDLPSDLDVKRYFPLEISFADGRFGYSMLDFLAELETLIEAVLELFRLPLTTGEPAPSVMSLLQLSPRHKAME